MMEDLIEDISLADDDPSLRCIVLKAEGRVFSAGHDLKELVKIIDIINFIIFFCNLIVI